MRTYYRIPESRQQR